MDIVEKIDVFLEASINKQQVIGENCSEFLLKAIGGHLYHGTKKPLKFENFFTTRSAPRNTPKAVHEKLNAAFKTVFGIAARTDCLFTNGNANVVKYYGTPWKIYPADGFKFIWSPEIADFTDHVTMGGQASSPYCERIICRYFGFLKRKSIKDIFKYAEDDLKKCLGKNLMQDMDYTTVYSMFEKSIQPYFNEFVKMFYENTNLADAIDSGNEVMLYSPRFYVIKS